MGLPPPRPVTPARGLAHRTLAPLPSFLARRQARRRRPSSIITLHRVAGPPVTSAHPLRHTTTTPLAVQDTATPATPQERKP